MPATSGSGSEAGSGAVSLVRVARRASCAILMSRLSRYLTCDLVRFSSLLTITTVRSQKSLASLRLWLRRRLRTLSDSPT